MNWQDVAGKTVKNSVWSFLGFALGKLVAFVATVILANILVPEQFGQVAFCIVALQFFDILARFGLDTALISRGDTAEEDASTIFCIGLGTAAFSYAVAWVTAHWIAQFFRAPEIETMMRVIALVILIDSLSLVHNALLILRLRFRQRMVPVIGKSVAKAIASVSLAMLGFGVWSLVYGQIVGSIAATLIFWFLSNWRPKFNFSRPVGSQVTRYGASMIGVEFIGAIRATIDLTLVGRYFGAGNLGNYSLAYRLPELVIRSLDDAVGKVTYPVLVGLRDSAGQSGEYYVGYIRFTALLTLPMGVGMAAISEPFVLTFYGENWQAAIFPMQAIALALAINSISFAPGVYYKAMNRPDILRNISFAKLPFLIGATWYAVRWGIDGVALTKLFLAALFVAFDCYTVSRFSGISMGVVVKALSPAVIASTIMGLAVGTVTETMSSNGLLEIAAGVGLGVPLYIALIRIVSPSAFAELKNFRLSPRKGAS